MSEQAALIRSVPPIKEKPAAEVVEKSVPSESSPPAVTVLPEDSGNTVLKGGESASNTTRAVISESSDLPGESNGSITTFQGINYGSFILTFCLAGFEQRSHQSYVVV